jgi:hypothetical protein
MRNLGSQIAAVVAVASGLVTVLTFLDVDDSSMESLPGYPLGPISAAVALIGGLVFLARRATSASVRTQAPPSAPEAQPPVVRGSDNRLTRKSCVSVTISFSLVLAVFAIGAVVFALSQFRPMYMDAPPDDRVTVIAMATVTAIATVMVTTEIGAQPTEDGSGDGIGGQVSAASPVASPRAVGSPQASPTAK